MKLPGRQINSFDVAVRDASDASGATQKTYWVTCYPFESVDAVNVFAGVAETEADANKIMFAAPGTGRQPGNPPGLRLCILTRDLDKKDHLELHLAELFGGLPAADGLKLVGAVMQKFRAASATVPEAISADVVSHLADQL